MGKHVAPQFLFLIPFFITITFCFGTDLAPAIIEGPTKAPIGCHKRIYTYRVSQLDAKGFQCNDEIEVNVCWGRCDTKEISDWKFPFKKSYHPVCVHSGRTKVSVMLRNCDPDAGIEARKYDYTEPIACSCQTCTTSDTACESPSQRGNKKELIAESVDALLSDDYMLSEMK